MNQQDSLCKIDTFLLPLLSR